MKKRIITVIIIILIMFPAVSYAYSSAEIVIESTTGRVLHENNPDTPLPMASTTKIMTAITAIEFGDLDSPVKASKYAASTTGSRMELREGDELTLGDLITSLLFVSANDGATAIAEHISGDETDFAEMMTKKAKEIGCTDTSFANAHGLDAPNHYTTAGDLAKIAAYAIKNEVFYDIVSSAKKDIVINGRTVTFYNKNKLKSMYPYGIGGKTGYTEDAGRCLVSYAEKDGMMLISVVLNSTDYYGDSIALLEEAYRKYSMTQVAHKGQYIASIPIKNGYTNTYSVTFPENIFAPLTEYEVEHVRMQYLLPEYITAPVNSDSELGRYALTLGDERILLGILHVEEEIEKRDSVWEKALKMLVYSANQG